MYVSNVRIRYALAIFLLLYVPAVLSFTFESDSATKMFGKLKSGFQLAGELLGVDATQGIAQLVANTFGKAGAKKGETGGDNGQNIFGGLLRILGLDTKKVGAIAINAIIFVAQLAKGSVDVGYVESCNAWKLESKFFPSKLGGKPAWLDQENLPEPTELQCKVCQKPMAFLAQLYAPIEDDDNNFHRTVLIFMCKESSCFAANKSDNFVALRNQLRRENNFYSYEAPVEVEEPNDTPDKWCKLCVVCGCKGTKNCGQCKKVSYCSREHQVIDWKNGHKAACNNDNATSSQSGKAPSNAVYAEYEIVIEAEEGVAKAPEAEDVLEARELEKFQALKREGKTGTLDDTEEVSESDLQAHAMVDADKAFTRFKKRVDINPDQIVRYDRGGTPLWIASEPKIESPEDVPVCPYCNGPRQFEFQVMPQLICSLKDDNVDWGILSVYTCKQSCLGSPAYKKEFIFKQDVTV